MTWFFYALLSLGFFTFYELLSRKLSVDSPNPRALAVVFYTLVAIASPILFLIEPYHQINLTPTIILFSIGSAISWSIFGRVEFFAHKYVEASTLGIVVKIAPVLTLIYGALFFNEPLTLFKVMGMTLTVVSSVYLIWKIEKGRPRLSKGLIFALIVALALSAGWTFDKIISPYFGVAILTFLGFGIPAIVSELTPPLGVKELKKEFSRTSWQLIILALINLFGYAFLIKSLMLGEASRAAPIATATTPLVVLLAAIFLKEKDHFKTKLMVAVLTIVGIFLLS